MKFRFDISSVFKLSGIFLFCSFFSGVLMAMLTPGNPHIETVWKFTWTTLGFVTGQGTSMVEKSVGGTRGPRSRRSPPVT